MIIAAQLLRLLLVTLHIIVFMLYVTYIIIAIT